MSAAALAGCLSGVFDSSSGEPPLVEDRPDAVYLPTHTEGMEMVGMTEAGEYQVALSYSYAHRFWLVTGRDPRIVEIEDDDTVHLMATIWDPESGLVLPNANLSMTISDGGEPVAEGSMWAMLSQNMGIHAGDNISLPGDGTYEVDLRIGAMDARRSGGLAGRFDEPGTATMEFEYADATRDEIAYQLLEDEQGDRGAVDPMEMEMVPVSQAPSPDDLPGDVLGEATSGDATFVVTVLPEPPDGIDGSGSYLAISARTPYNRYPLPFMSLSATIARDGQPQSEADCLPTVDPDLDYHYGAVIDAPADGDELTITVDAPPQLARHEGYETAFLAMDAMTLTI